MYSRDDVQQTLRKLGTRHRGLMLSENSFFSGENDLSQDEMTVQNEALIKADMMKRHINPFLQQINLRRVRGQYN